MDTNGQVTTTPTGFLSPYGDFFPTNVGAVALVTMTNWGADDRGTGIVYVVSLATDLNRDGVIDPTFFGPDQTTSDHPFRFWINDSQDWGDDGGTGVPGASKPNGQYNLVNGTRDLVNFFPVSLEIQSLLQAFPANTFSCWLKHADSALNYADPDYIDVPIYATNCLAYLTDTNLARAIAPAYPRVGIPATAPTYNITYDGAMLSQSFVEGIREGSGSVLLIEAKAPTAQPLVLEIRQGTNVLVQAPLYLTISGVEQMFRQKNLIRETFPSATELPGFGDRLTTGDGWSTDPGSAWNEPDTNDKNFVFLHGYNVNPAQARGMFADVFKRLYWAGSHARFYAVTWDGYETQFAGITWNYHTNVANAFLTAPRLAAFLGTLTNGPTTVCAHSLGNMVALSALSDWNARMANYFMLDAAVAIEAIDGTAPTNGYMAHSDWTDTAISHWGMSYGTNVWASYWHLLFPASDGRSQLNWNSRLANFGTTEVYDFYSSGEEVLRTYTTRPTPLFTGIAADKLWQTFWTGVPLSSYVWCLEELGKGTSPVNTVLGSTHGGWGFNILYNTYTNGAPFHISPADAARLTASQLQTNPVFDATYDGPLFGASGSQYAQTNRNRILADAIPALTLVVGANVVTNLDVRFGEQHNFNMQTLENGWPQDRLTSGEQNNNWYHGDFHQVAYTFTYQLFDRWVNLGNLK